MNAHLIDDMQAQGFVLSLTDAGGLAITPASRLSDQQREMIRQNRAAIVDYLTAANDPHPDAQAAEPKRLFRPRGPWLTASETAASKEYHQHHANCQQCQAGGRGYSSRCSAGADLWDQYQQEGTTQ